MQNLRVINQLSHLTQVRGLKLERLTNTFQSFEVAPHAGAWIETFLRELQLLGGYVAPHAGAWIETRESND